MDAQTHDNIFRVLGVRSYHSLQEITLTGDLPRECYVVLRGRVLVTVNVERLTEKDQEQN